MGIMVFFVRCLGYYGNTGLVLVSANNNLVSHYL